MAPALSHNVSWAGGGGGAGLLGSQFGGLGARVRRLGRLLDVLVCCLGCRASGFIGCQVFLPGASLANACLHKRFRGL